MPANVEEMLPMGFASGPSKRKKPPTPTARQWRHCWKRQLLPLPPNDPYPHLLPPLEPGGAPAAAGGPRSASSAGPGVLASDVSALGASYAHNFRLHTREWVDRKKEEREAELAEEERPRTTRVPSGTVIGSASRRRGRSRGGGSAGTIGVG